MGKDQGSEEVDGGKIDRANVMASLTTECPKCRYQIPPNETQRVSFRTNAVPEVSSGVCPRPEERLVVKSCH
jgi:hypothetical protein